MRKLDNIDIRLLRVFIILIESGGFGPAQIVLNLSPSTLSTHLSDLEKKVGGQLCIRGRNSLRLTELGQATFDAAKILFGNLEDFRHRIAAASGLLAGRLRIGIVDGVVTSSTLGLQEIIRRMLKPEFDVIIDIVQATPLELEQAVANGSRDVAIGPFMQRAPGAIYEPVFDEPHYLYCGTGHELFAMDSEEVTEEVVQRAQFSVRSYRQLDDMYRIGTPKFSASVLQMEAQAMVILSGRFIGFLPEHFALQFVKEGRMRAVKPLTYFFSSQHQVVYKEQDRDRPLIQAFVAAVKAHIGGFGG
jgi:LysR family transcriptional regulator, transcriptional activator for bauABCD operon